MENVDVKVGTCGGTLLVLFSNLNLERILETIVLAGIGAIVSLFVSWIAKWLFTRRK